MKLHGVGYITRTSVRPCSTVNYNICKSGSYVGDYIYS